MRNDFLPTLLSAISSEERTVHNSEDIQTRLVRKLIEYLALPIPNRLTTWKIPGFLGDA